MAHDIGWLRVYDQTEVENRFTRERLVKRGSLTAEPNYQRNFYSPRDVDNYEFCFWGCLRDGFSIKEWDLYEYQHEGKSIPLAVGRFLFETGSFRRSFRALDYGYSLRLAQRAGVKNCDPHFGYGLWRRLEEFTVEALFAAIIESGEDLSTIILLTAEGWFNGQWRPELCSAASLGGLPGGYTDGFTRSANRLAIPHEPIPLTPIDAAPPKPWQFYPLPEEERGEPTRELPADLLPDGYDSSFLAIPFKDWPMDGAGVSHGDGKPAPPLQRAPLMTREQRLSIVGRTPCLMSGDGERILYMRTVHVYWAKAISYGHHRYYDWVYSDDSVTMSARWEANSRLAPPAARNNLGYDVTFIGLANPSFSLRRSERLDGSKFNLPYSYTVTPNMPLHRHIIEAHVDGFLSWQGSKARNGEWPSMIDLKPAVAVCFSPLLFGLGYCQVPIYGKRAFWLDQGPNPVKRVKLGVTVEMIFGKNAIS